MKHTNKKGFTIVELVIVIAVIAILAAVLIPTFSNLIKKANLSADQQAVRQMNTVLAAEQDLGADIDRVIDILAENGYNSKGALIPVTKGHAFFYYVDYACIVLVNTEKGEVVYPAEVVYTDDAAKAINLEGSAKYIDVVANDAATLAQAIAGGSEKISLTTNMQFTAPATVNAGSNVTIDLGGNNLSTGARDNVSHHYGLDVYGTVTITNGTIDARGIQTYNNGKVIIGEGATVNAIDTNGGACVWNRVGCEVTITGGVFNALNGDCDDVNDAAGTNEPGVINNSGTATITGGTFTAVSNCYLLVNTGNATIDGGNFTASRGVIAAAGGTVEINGGTFATEEGATAHVVYASNGQVVVNAGTFTGKICVDGKGTGSITLKAGVIVNDVTLANDVVLNAGDIYQ